MTSAKKAQYLINILRKNEMEWRLRAMTERSELAGLEASHKQWEADQTKDDFDWRNPYSSLDLNRERVAIVESDADEAAEILNFATDHFLKYVV
jgi:hypothetical protein